ncbi:MAG: hypothetical protein AB1560_03095 [Pseudomonadota bacterium]
MTNRFQQWFTVRHRKSIAVAVAGWMSLSLVLAFWPCCQVLAQDHPPAAHISAGDHDHGSMPAGPDDPCRTWLDNADAALNTSFEVLLPDLELKIAHAAHVGTRDFPALSVFVPGRHLYHPSPPASLPLYLRVQHLLI